MNQIFLRPKSTVAVLSIIMVVVIAAVLSTFSTQAAQTTVVTATVGSTVSCTPDGGTAELGTILTSGVSTASPAITVTNSCTSGGGCAIYIQDAGDGVTNPGLYASLATGTPLIASATATLVAGTEGYGIQATTTAAGTGAALTLSATYNKSGTAVGGLLRTATSIASTIAPFSAKIITVNTLAAISVLTKAGTYADTITYSCTGV